MTTTAIRPSQIFGVPLGDNLSSLVKADNTEVTVTNTVTETTIWSATIAANTLGANDALRLTMSMSWLNNSGVAQVWTYRVKLGGTTILTMAPQILGVSATAGGGILEAVIKNAGATNSQKGAGALFGSGTGTNSALGNTTGNSGTSAIDMTLNQSLVVTVQFAAATATQTLIEYMATLEYLKAT